MKLFEKKIESTEVFKGNIIRVFKDTIELENGKIASREVVRHNGAVCIVPINENNEVIIERQFRYPLNRVVMEIPAGKLEVDEDPEECAKRELEEETGYIAENLEFIGLFYGSPAILDEKISMYLATGLKKGKAHLDSDEFLEVTTIPIKELVDMIMSGEITDAKTQCGVLKVWNMFNNNKSTSH